MEANEFIREFIEARGGIGELKKEEKKALALMTEARANRTPNFMINSTLMASRLYGTLADGMNSVLEKKLGSGATRTLSMWKSHDGAMKGKGVGVGILDLSKGVEAACREFVADHKKAWAEIAERMKK